MHKKNDAQVVVEDVKDNITHEKVVEQEVVVIIDTPQVEELIEEANIEFPMVQVKEERIVVSNIFFSFADSRI